MARKPLEGVKVLDLTHGVAGPYCTMLLADLGADVIKIEKPGRGDATRYMNVSDKFTDDIPRVGGDYFLGINRGKRSLELDMSMPEGRRLCEQLAGWADVVAQNFSPGVVQRLGVSHEDLKKFNPKLVYANISAYGTEGPLSHRAGMDVAVQARAGLMQITGSIGSTDPVRLGASIADFGGGIYLTTAILAALFDRERTGRGQEVSVSLLDVTMSMLANYSVAVMDGDADVHPIGSGHPQLVPYQAFPTSDGHVVIAAGTNRTFSVLAGLLGRPELDKDERFRSNQHRVANRAALIELMEPLVALRTTAEWIKTLEDANIPCAPVNDIKTAFSELRETSPSMSQSVAHPVLGRLSQVGNPFRFSDSSPDLTSAPPLLGEHNTDVLKNVLKLSDDEVSALRAAKAVG